MHDEDLMAPCGMNCGLCIAYQFRKGDLNRHGFRKKYCPGCIPRGEHCLHMGSQCALLKKGTVRFCFECSDFPCPRLTSLDKRYRNKYHLSTIENLLFIKAHGMEAFLQRQNERWQCPRCRSPICCHNGLCLHCSLDTLIKNKKYRWGEN